MPTKVCAHCSTMSETDADKCPNCKKSYVQKKKMGLGKKILIGFGAMFAIGVLANMSGNNTSTSGSAGSKPAASERKPEPPAVKVTAKQILKEYEANKLAAEQKYQDKVIEVTGYVDSIGSDIMDTPYIALGNGGQYEMFHVQAMFDREEKGKLAAVKKGARMTIKGRVSGYTMNVLLNDSSF